MGIFRTGWAPVAAVDEHPLHRGDIFIVKGVPLPRPITGAAESLELLNEKEQRCLMLRAEGLSYQEIADVLETTAKSVSVYLARGLKKFESKNEDIKN